MSLIYSAHARDRLRARRISEEEVEEAFANAVVETPGRSADRVNLWGETGAGRRLRITVYRNRPYFVITVVAPGEERA